jgi:hypothetical protein
MEAFGLLLHGFAVLLTWVAILVPLTFTMDPTSAILATTKTSNRGRASPSGRSQPRINSRRRSDTIPSSTSVLVSIFLGQPSHRLDERGIVWQFLDAGASWTSTERQLVHWRLS